jgi:histone deacetylase HOS3
VTENSIAEDWFKQELERHETAEAAVNTIVVLHEACYGHRFARPKTTKTTLGLIVERPERIEASTMGISAAYVRLGERHNEGQYAPDPRLRPPPHLPFKIRRTARTMPINSPAVTQVHGTKWMDELKIMCDTTPEKLASTGRETDRPIDPTNKNKPAFHSGDLYLCADSLAAFEGALGGVCEGVDAVFTPQGPSQAFVCIRPPGHHCSADFPSGFCWLNNVHVGIQHAVREHGLTHAAIIDFDLHHGDGSQQIAWEHNRKVAAMPKNTPVLRKTAIGYYSIHDINSYPCENGDADKILNASVCLENAHNQAIWNVHLQPWSTEAEFWELYETKYCVLLEKARIFLQHHTAKLRANPNAPQAKAAIFISAGFDASEHEGAGMQRHSVNVPTEFYARFTRDIVALAQEEGTSVDGRVISVLEGGYSDKALISGVLSHVSGLCHGQSVSNSAPQQNGDGLADEMARLTMNVGGGLSGVPGATSLAGINDLTHQLRYNAEWWASSHLDALVEILNPAPSMPAFEAVKSGRSNNFASPTQASKMKVVDPVLLQRRSSAQFARSVSRPATPPPPAVHWTVAAQELCKLLIPRHRQTKSHTASELAAPKIKKERASAIGLQSVPAVSAPRQLREKRATTVKATPPIPEEGKRVVSRGAGADRRRTIAANEIANPSAAAANGVSGRPVAERTRRRSSIASTVSNMSAAPSVAPPRPKLPTNGSGSGTAPSAGVTVKKSRPASRPPVSGTTTATGPTRPAAVPGRTASSSRSPSVGAEMDSLVSKTQKLKINMPSNEDYVARQRAAPSTSTATSRATKPVTTTTTGAAKKPVGRPPKSGTATSSGAKKPASGTTAAAGTKEAKVKSPLTEDLTPDIPGTGAFQVEAPSLSAGGAPPAAGLGLNSWTTGQFQLEMPVPQPQAQAPPVAPPPAPAPAVEQQAQSPAPVAVKEDVESAAVPAAAVEKQAPPPLWSSTGHIPFAGAAPGPGGVVSGVRAEVKQEEGGAKEGSIWDVPDTPAKPESAW